MNRTEKYKEEEWALKAVGCPVNFKEPYKRKGILLDRVPSYFRTSDSFYINIIDLIEFKDGIYIRFGYYRRHIFAGQTTLTEPINRLTDIFVKAMVEKKWFYDFIENVCSRAEKIKDLEKSKWKK